MRDFGLGKRSLDDRMREEASFLVEEIGKTNGQPADLTLLLPLATANVICSIIIGTRFDTEQYSITVLHIPVVLFHIGNGHKATTSWKQIK